MFRFTTTTWVAISIGVLAVVGATLFYFYSNPGHYVTKPSPPADFDACGPLPPVDPLVPMGKKKTCVQSNCGLVPGYPPYVDSDTGTSIGFPTQDEYCCPHGTGLNMQTRKCHPSP